MEQVEVFEGNPGDVEKRVNDWYRENSGKISIIARQASSVYDRDINETRIVIAIFYTDKH